MVWDKIPGIRYLRGLGRASGPPPVETVMPADASTFIADGTVNFHVTLWPAFPHFPRFAADHRIQGIRLNSAMMAASEIDGVFRARRNRATVPLWFDVKAMQMRIREVVNDHTTDHLEFILNRPVKVKTPCAVYFKAGEDRAKLVEIRDGTHFIFEGGPRFEVRAGESIHILEPGLEVGGPTFLPYELEKIDIIKGLGFSRWYLSYCYSQRHVDEFRELVGRTDEVVLKIENVAGLEFAATKYRCDEKTRLMTARGDLFVELPKPHMILNACKTVIERDPGAFVGSRMLLSLNEVKGKPYEPIPCAADLSELAWLHDIGYRNFLLCDELCLKEHMMGAATKVFDSFRNDYCK